MKAAPLYDIGMLVAAFNKTLPSLQRVNDAFADGLGDLLELDFTAADNPASA